MLYISARNIIFNPKTAWASPKAIPEWVQKRCTAKDVYWISRLIILKTSWNSSYSATTISSWLRLVGIWLSNRYCIYACSVSCILFQKVQIQSFIQRVKIHWRDEMAVLNMSQVDDVIVGQYRCGISMVIWWRSFGGYLELLSHLVRTVVITVINKWTFMSKIIMKTHFRPTRDTHIPWLMNWILKFELDHQNLHRKWARNR